jgi:cell division septation protein DedD
MRFLLLLVIFCGLSVGTRGQDGVAPASQPAPQTLPTTAFDAINLLPPGAAKRVAIIEGREGTPIPERWYLVVYDPAQEHHLTEYVVANGRLVASRPLSQFAQEIAPEDVLRIDGDVMNSDRAFQLVEQFANANNLRVASINYRLRKEGVGSAPLWKITCLDDSESPFAGMTVAANSGTIIETNGFNLPPSAVAAAAANPAPAKSAAPEPATRTTEARAASQKKPSEQASQKRNNPNNRAKNDNRRQGKPEPVAEEPERRGGFFQMLRHFIRGHEE